MLLVVPIALCAIEFGLRGGLAAGIVGVAAVLGWELASENGVGGGFGVATRATAFLVVGGLLGRYVDERRALETQINRYYDLSLDLFCTADFNGHFTRLNSAWEKTLGHSQAALMKRPFGEFVHPDDRDSTAEVAANLTRGQDAVRFRNRYQTAAGDYRWIEWNALAVAEERRIYATARDITEQQLAEEALEDQSDRLEQMVRQRTSALESSRLEGLQRLALAAEYRDDDTHQHTQRVGRTAAAIAQGLGFTVDRVSLIRQAAPLHDVGKLGVSDLILLKPGKLTPEEFGAMQEHVRIGAAILTDGRFAVVQMAEEIALSHHERWDGTGYLRGLSGESIPLTGRIVAVADVFDALTHARPYKQAWPVEKAVAEIEQAAGSHFDPRVVEVFAALDHYRLIASVEDYDLELPPPPLTAAEERLEEALVRTTEAPS